jgi:hypothetical protein
VRGDKEWFGSDGVLKSALLDGVNIKLTACLRRAEKSSIFSAKRFRGSVIPDSRYPSPW